MSYIPAWAFNPLIGLALVALLIGTGAAVGWSKGKASQAKADAALIAKADKRAGDAATALRAAAVRLAEDARLFREIDAETAANAAAANRAVGEAQKQAQAAARDAAQTQKRMAGLEKQLAGERDTCTDGRKPICGIPLR